MSVLYKNKDLYMKKCSHQYVSCKEKVSQRLGIVGVRCLHFKVCPQMFSVLNASKSSQQKVTERISLQSEMWLHHMSTYPG